MRPPRPLLPPRCRARKGLPLSARQRGVLPLGGWLASGLLLTALAAAGPGRAQSPPPPPPPLNPGWAFDPTGPFQPGPADAPLLLPGNGGRFTPNARPPLAIGAPLPLVPPCPLIVPPREAVLQPLHLPPAMVPLKNRFGCLSAADAIYGPDGCPKRLCRKAESPIRLPPGGP